MYPSEFLVALHEDHPLCHVAVSELLRLINSSGLVATVAGGQEASIASLWTLTPVIVQ
jgi:hypothetical protein